MWKLYKEGSLYRIYENCYQLYSLFLFYINTHYPFSLPLIMRHCTILAASSLILCNFLVDAITTPTAQDIATLTSRRKTNIIDIGESSTENVNIWYETWLRIVCCIRLLKFWTVGNPHLDPPVPGQMWITQQAAMPGTDTNIWLIYIVMGQFVNTKWNIQSCYLARSNTFN